MSNGVYKLPFYTANAHNPISRYAFDFLNFPSEIEKQEKLMVPGTGLEPVEIYGYGETMRR